MGSRGPGFPTELHFLAPGERRFRKVADNLFVLGFTRDADGNVLTTRERSRSEPGSFVEMEGPIPAYPILRRNRFRSSTARMPSGSFPRTAWSFAVPRPNRSRKPSARSRPGTRRASDQSGDRREPGRSRRDRVVGCPGRRSQVLAQSPRAAAIASGAGSLVHARARRRGGGVDQCGRWGRNVRPLPGHGREGRSPTVDAGSVQLRLPGTGQGPVVRRRKRAVAHGQWPPRESRAPEGGGRGSEFFTTMTHDGSGGFWVGGYGLHHLKHGDWTTYERRAATRRHQEKLS